MSIIDLPLPEQFAKYSEDTQTKIIQYLEHLNTIERLAYQIAYDHLGSSFNIIKSNGYCDWLKTQV
uniref:Uncharacterized protein n=1 Tax=viral metagenome TaxID=1070528 RepID=A0A6C0IU24_9ZZZZ